MGLGEALAIQFPNGEVQVRIEENVRGADVFVMQSPNGESVDHGLMELLVMIDALRRASARRITAVVPYLPYARREKKTAGREHTLPEVDGGPGSKFHTVSVAPVLAEAIRRIHENRSVSALFY